MTITIIRKRPARRKGGIIVKHLEMLPVLLVGVVGEIDALRLLAAVADQVEVTGAWAHLIVKFVCFVVESFMPEIPVEFGLTEVVRGFEEAAAFGEASDDLPEFVVELLANEVFRRRQFDSVVDELAS